MSEDLLWSEYAGPDDLAAVTVLPDAASWRQPERRTFAGLLADAR